METTTHFKSFRSAAKHFAKAGWTYDEACEITKILLQKNEISIGRKP